MIVKDVISMCQLRLRNISLFKEKHALIKILSCGVADLYNRFNLSIKAEAVPIRAEKNIYELASKDVLMLLALFDSEGNELTQTDVLDSRLWQWKQVNYRSFLLHNLKKSVIIAIYKAAPKELDSEEEFIDLPDIMMNALILYVTYAVNSTVMSQAANNRVGRGAGSEADILYQHYVNEIKDLENQGYKVNINTESLSLISKGFV